MIQEKNISNARRSNEHINSYSEINVRPPIRTKVFNSLLQGQAEGRVFPESKIFVAEPWFTRSSKADL